VKATEEKKKFIKGGMNEMKSRRYETQIIRMENEIFLLRTALLFVKKVPLIVLP
jgi:hypothetical protein